MIICTADAALLLKKATNEHHSDSFPSVPFVHILGPSVIIFFYFYFFIYRVSNDDSLCLSGGQKTILPLPTTS